VTLRLTRRSLIAGTTTLVACEAPIVRRVEEVPIAADASAATVVFITPYPSRYGVTWLADVPWPPASTPRPVGALLGACHAIVRVPPGRHFFFVYYDGTYDGTEGDLAAAAIYSVELDRSSGDIELHPQTPGKDSIRRQLDETTRVELARELSADELAELRHKAELARHRYDLLPPHKRSRRFIRSEHAWR
jgi:hypothetical protein